MKDQDFVKKSRKILGLSQAKLAESLGWKGAKQVSNLETGTRPLQLQTSFAIECLLRRAGKWGEFNGE